MQDAWRAYLELALGLTEAPRKRAQQVAGELVNRGGATAAQVQGLVEDLLSSGLANREALTSIVRYEVDRALGLVGLATADEVSDLTGRVRDLERQLRDARARAGEDGAAGADSAVGDGEDDRVIEPAAPAPAARKAVAKKAVAKKAVAKKAVAKKAVAQKAAEPVVEPPAGTAAAPTAPVKEAAAATELPPAKKAVAKKAVAKKAVAKKAVAKKATPAKSTPAKSTPAKRAAKKTAPPEATP